MSDQGKQVLVYYLPVNIVDRIHLLNSLDEVSLLVWERLFSRFGTEELVGYLVNHGIVRFRDLSEERQIELFDDDVVLPESIDAWFNPPKTQAVSQGDSLEAIRDEILQHFSQAAYDVVEGNVASSRQLKRNVPQFVRQVQEHGLATLVERMYPSQNVPAVGDGLILYYVMYFYAIYDLEEVTSMMDRVDGFLGDGFVHELIFHLSRVNKIDHIDVIKALAAMDDRHWNRLLAIYGRDALRRSLFNTESRFYFTSGINYQNDNKYVISDDAFLDFLEQDPLNQRIVQQALAQDHTNPLFLSVRLFEFNEVGWWNEENRKPLQYIRDNYSDYFSSMLLVNILGVFTEPGIFGEPVDEPFMQWLYLNQVQLDETMERDWIERIIAADNKLLVLRELILEYRWGPASIQNLPFPNEELMDFSIDFLSYFSASFGYEDLQLLYDFFGEDLVKHMARFMRQARTYMGDLVRIVNTYDQERVNQAIQLVTMNQISYITQNGPGVLVTVLFELAVHDVDELVNNYRSYDQQQFLRAYDNWQSFGPDNFDVLRTSFPEENWADILVNHPLRFVNFFFNIAEPITSLEEARSSMEPEAFRAMVSDALLSDRDDLDLLEEYSLLKNLARGDQEVPIERVRMRLQQSPTFASAWAASETQANRLLILNLVSALEISRSLGYIHDHEYHEQRAHATLHTDTWHDYGNANSGLKFGNWLEGESKGLLLGIGAHELEHRLKTAAIAIEEFMGDARAFMIYQQTHWEKGVSQFQSFLRYQRFADEHVHVGTEVHDVARAQMKAMLVAFDQRNEAVDWNTFYESYTAVYENNKEAMQDVTYFPTFIQKTLLRYVTAKYNLPEVAQQKLATALLPHKENVTSRHGIKEFLDRAEELVTIDVEVEVKDVDEETENNDVAHADNLGGIDLNPMNMGLVVQGAYGLSCEDDPDQDGCINFSFTPEQVDELRQSITGVTPVIINVQPLVDVGLFLGRADNKNDLGVL